MRVDRLDVAEENQPVRNISASAQASPLSLLIRRLFMASAARRASMQIIGEPIASSDRNRCGVNGPLSSPTLSKDPLNRCKAPSIISGWVSTVPRHTVLPDPSITQIAVRLPPTSNPAYIFIAAPHSLLTNHLRRVSPTPESSNLMYGTARRKGRQTDMLNPPPPPPTPTL